MLNSVSRNREIVGYDYDKDKISVANNCAMKNDNVTFHAADITEAELRQSDIFILNDVLHYLPENLQVEMIAKCCNKLNMGGQIIIRDADKDMQKRHFGTRLSEFMSTNIGFNKTKFKLEFISSATVKDVAEVNNMSLEIIDQSKLTSNLIYILKHK